MHVTIRPAQEYDLDDIVRLGEKMHKYSTFSSMTFDPETLWGFLRKLLVTPGHEVFVADVGDEVCGMLACSVTQHVFGPDLMGIEYFWYVTPEQRNTGVGRDLLLAFADWAKAQGAVRIQAGNSAGMPDDVYVNLLSSVGLEKVGSLMYQDV